jgi:hypothetical protein
MGAVPFNDRQIPTAWFNPLVGLLANECATAFGAQKSAALRGSARSATGR